MRIHIGFVKADIGTAVGLGAIQRPVGMLDKELRIHPVVWRYCNSDPDAQRCGDVLEQERLSHGYPDAPRKRCRIVE